MHNSKARRPGAHSGRYNELVAALRYADFRVLWVSTVSNQLGQGIQQVLLGWLVFEMTGSGGMVGLVFAARSAPNLVIGFVAGVITDRWDRRSLMRASVVGMTLCAGLLGFLVSIDRLAIWQLMLITFFLGAFQAFYMTARQTYVFDIVGSAGAINGIALISMAQRVGGIAGALIAGGLIHWLGPGASFLAMAAGYLLGVLPLYWLRRAGQAAPQQREPLWQNLVSYVNALRTNPTLLVLMVTTSASEIFGFSHQVVLPILAKEVLHVGAAGLGLITAFRYVGGALGVFVAAALSHIRRRGLLLLVILILFGGGEMLLSQAPNLWVTLVIVAFINVMASGTDILHHTLLQMSVPNEQRGRAMGVWVVGLGTAPVGQLELGYLAGAANSRIALLINGAALAGSALVLGIIMPRLRRL